MCVLGKKVRLIVFVMSRHGVGKMKALWGYILACEFIHIFIPELSLSNAAPDLAPLSFECCSSRYGEKSIEVYNRISNTEA